MDMATWFRYGNMQITGSCSGEVTYLFEIAQLTEILERKEKYARVPQSLRFFG